MRVNQCEPNLFVSYFYSRVLSTFQCSYIYLFFSFVISVIKFYAYTRAGAPNAPHNGSPNVGSVMKTQEQKKKEIPFGKSIVSIIKIPFGILLNSVRCDAMRCVLCVKWFFHIICIARAICAILNPIDVNISSFVQ